MRLQQLTPEPHSVLANKAFNMQNDQLTVSIILFGRKKKSASKKRKPNRKRKRQRSKNYNKSSLSKTQKLHNHRQHKTHNPQIRLPNLREITQHQQQRETQLNRQRYQSSSRKRWILLNHFSTIQQRKNHRQVRI